MTGARENRNCPHHVHTLAARCLVNHYNLTSGFRRSPARVRKEFSQFTFGQLHSGNFFFPTFIWYEASDIGHSWNQATGWDEPMLQGGTKNPLSQMVSRCSHAQAHTDYPLWYQERIFTQVRLAGTLEFFSVPLQHRALIICKGYLSMSSNQFSAVIGAASIAWSIIFPGTQLTLAHNCLVSWTLKCELEPGF